VNQNFSEIDEYSKFIIMSGGNSVSKGGLVLANRQFQDVIGTNTVSVNPLYTTTGIKFITPLEINNKKVTNFTWSNNNATLNCTDKDATNITIVMSNPDGYSKYSDFLGTFDFHYTNRYNVNLVRTIVIKEKAPGQSYKVENMIINMPDLVEMRHDKTRGMITLSSQFLMNNPSTGHPVSLFPAIESFSFYANTSEGYGRFIGRVNDANQRIEFIRDPNGTLSEVTVGFTTIERRPDGNYGWDNDNATFRNMYMIKK
jgi:hypothetical protein